MNRESLILEQIMEYTRQLELYERTSTYYSAICMAVIIVVIGLIVYMAMSGSGNGDDKKGRRGSDTADKILPVLFLLIPSIIELYLYTFAMNMRKGAMYRGYLSFLEKELNEVTGAADALFDSYLVGLFLDSKQFLTNGAGPFAMGIFLVAAVFGSFAFAIYYMRRLKEGIYKKIIRLAIVLFIVISIAFDSIYVYSLSTNDNIVNNVEQYCIEIHESSAK